MDTNTIIEYIKKHYPKVIFTPFKTKYSNAIGFIVTGGKIIIGYINKNGTICKLIEPLDLENLSSEKIQDTIKKIPIVKGFNDNDKQTLLEIFQNKKVISDKENEQIIKTLTEKLNDATTKNTEYKVLFDSNTNETVLIKNKYEEKIKVLSDQYNQLKNESEQCKTQLLEEKQKIIENIQKYKEEMLAFASNNDIKVKDLEKMYNNLKDEKRILEKKISNLLENEKILLNKEKENEDKLKIIIKKGENNEDDQRILKLKLDESSNTIKTKEEELVRLRENIAEVRQSLNETKESLKKTNLQNLAIEGYKKRCQQKLLKEKDQIIEEIKRYNDSWFKWSNTVKDDVNHYRKRVLEDLQTIYKNLKLVLAQKIENDSIIKIQKQKLEEQKQELSQQELSQEQLKQQQVLEENILELKNEIKIRNREYTKLKQNIADIEGELRKVITSQMMQLKAKDSEIQLLKESGVGFLVKKDNEQFEEKYLESQKVIANLRSELEKVKQLLEQNNISRIDKIEDTSENCLKILQNFITLNNIFYRKQEIISRLEKIINENGSQFSNLNETIKTNIKRDFIFIKNEINKHITFLDLKKYIDSPYITYLKNKTTRNKVPDSFCTELDNLLEYWNENIINYKEQDQKLTNIYEDLSGAVRVYIRIKPKTETENTNAVSIQPQTKSVKINCPNNTSQFGEFYGVFDETYSNIDLFTGIKHYSESELIIDTDALVLDTANPGLYSVFKQGIKLQI